eukprot:4913971-Pleurochrysis_carterae.AAC.2
MGMHLPGKGSRKCAGCARLLCSADCMGRYGSRRTASPPLSLRAAFLAASCSTGLWRRAASRNTRGKRSSHRSDAPKRATLRVDALKLANRQLTLSTQT